MLSELRSVLVHKQNEWKIREGKALARQKGEEYVEEEDNSSIESQMNKINPESFDLTAESFSDSDVDVDDVDDVDEDDDDIDDDKDLKGVHV